jgi:hypothetical protein
MGDIDIIYEHYCDKPGDINEHMPTLRKYAEMSETICEFGTRSAVSTFAFLVARPKKVVTVDIADPIYFGVNVTKIKDICEKDGIDFSFILANDLEIEIDPVDLLFIDTIHVYSQLKPELELHGSKVKKWIIMHDTNSSEELNLGGMAQALREFLSIHPEWKIKEVFMNNNGLTVMERIND